jgi:hypothetical protein
MIGQNVEGEERGKREKKKEIIAGDKLLHHQHYALPQ